MTELLEQVLTSADHRNGSTATCVGYIVEIDASGIALVDFPGNSGQPVAARSLLTFQNAEALPKHAQVLLWFENGDQSRPIILGVVHPRLIEPATPMPPVADNANASYLVAKVPESLVFEAKRELTLRCGAGSLTFRKDGKVLFKGTALVSHASGLNRIKGASVQIN